MKKEQKAKMRTYLCREPGGSNLPTEDFTIEAKTLREACKAAAVWNAVVVRLVKERKQ